jgi:two-component system cell cycle response regulator DivK
MDMRADSENGSRAIDPTDACVLVVEGAVPDFVQIARVLSALGVHQCEWKTSGWQLVQFIDTMPCIHLILMNLRLPYEDGYHALPKIRSNPNLGDVMVVAITTDSSEEQMRKAQRAGFDGLVCKPIDIARFSDQIRRILAGEAVWEWQ